MPVPVLLLVVAVVVLALVVWHQRVGRVQAQRTRDSDRERGEAALAASAAAARGFAAARQALLVLDGDGRIAAANAAAVQLVAQGSGLLGRRAADVLPWPELAARLARGAAGEFEVHTDERALVVHVGTAESGSTVVAIEDVSRVKRLESLRRDFVANVSHELKTPLAAILGFVETMLDDPAMDDATRRRFLERIASQSERLSTLVADLLTLSRLDEEGFADSGAEPNDFAAVCAETVRDLGPLAERRSLALGFQGPRAGLWVRGDREALRQLAGNLVDNAIKYTPNGQVRVLLEAEAGTARLQVVDTGLGLSPADQERVFERFYRVDRARSREVGGTGLGLSIVKNTVKNLGGRIGVRSELGKGSTFWIELPIVAPPA